MIASKTLSRVAIALLACTPFSNVVHAEGLQVAPVSVTIPERSGVVWLNNGSDQPLRAQVRVFRWHQDNGEDELVETDDVIASPPFVEIQPEGQQIIRLVRFGVGAVDMANCEQAYRIIVDELPSTYDDQELGLQYVLRYSVPVYLTNPDCPELLPELSWQITTDGEYFWLNVVNLGQTRAQLANVKFINTSGTRTEVSGGLLGYVLPGAERDFALEASAEMFADGGQLEVLVNGSQVKVSVSLAVKSQ